MNPVVTKNIARFISIFLIQVLVLKRIDFSFGSFDYVHLLIYPLTILLLPIKTSRAIVLVIAFIIGILIDMFYNSPGVHASALVFTAFLRGFILNILEPYEGYNTDDSPTIETMGIGWFLSYFSILLFAHCLWYFSVDAFSFVYFFDIALSTIFTFIPSILLILVLQLLFKPKY
jgi:hypothetical protein